MDDVEVSYRLPAYLYLHRDHTPPLDSLSLHHTTIQHHAMIRLIGFCGVGCIADECGKSWSLSGHELTGTTG
jgi:hypothetical protein